MNETRPSENPAGDDNEASRASVNHLRSLISESAQLSLLYRAVQSVRNGIVVTDPNLPDNPIIYANPAFAEITGFRVDQIVGRNCRFLQRDDRNQAALAEVRRAIIREESITTVLRNYRKDGSLFWNELTISPVHDERGHLINFVGIQNDISARKAAEKRLSEFYSVISHELRTPLASINAALGVIHEGSAGKVNANVLKLVTIALSNSERLMRLIADILDWKKLELGKISLTLSDHQPDQIVNEVIRDMDQRAKNAGVTLVKDVRITRAVHLDMDRIVQVLNNLMSNAIKFSPVGGKVIVRVDSTSDGATRFSVLDNGPGIPEDQRAKLFIHFQQLDSSDGRQKGGSGLGLAISKSLVEMHGGHIGMENSESGGSVFYFDLYGRKENHTED